MENIQKVQTETDASNRRLTARMPAEDLGMEREPVRTILKEDLGMTKICAKIVPKLLSDDQKARRVDLSREVLEQLEGNPEQLMGNPELSVSIL